VTALILSIFPGIDLLGRAFEQAGLCVVRGPDLITGGDIRTFHAPCGAFAGVIGGPPCQDFSRLNRTPGGYGAEMLREYVRIVTEAQPNWFLFENVLAAPDVRIAGYTQQRFALDLAWFSPFSRRRDFVFGSRHGVRLDPMNGVRGTVAGTCVTGSDARSYAACCEIQGVPGLQLPFFTQAGKKQAIANAVPMALGRYVAGLIAAAVYGAETSASAAASADVPDRRCGCGCGRVVVGQARYHNASCRKRAQRQPKCACGCGTSVSGRARYAGAACRKRAQRARAAAPARAG